MSNAATLSQLNEPESWTAFFNPISKGELPDDELLQAFVTDPANHAQFEFPTVLQQALDLKAQTDLVDGALAASWLIHRTDLSKDIKTLVALKEAAFISRMTQEQKDDLTDCQEMAFNFL